MKKKPLVIIFITVFIDLVGFGIIVPLSPYLARNFGAGAFEVGLLMAIYSLMQFIFAPIWGQLSDHIGRRPVILISLLGAGLAHLGFAFSTSLWMLFLTRALAGFCGANISTAMAYIADVTESKDRSKNMGLIGAAFGLGFILGPAIGGTMGQWGETLGSQPPFGHSFSAVVAGLICLLNFVMALKVLPESLPQNLRDQSPWRERLRKRPARLKLIWSCLRHPTLGPLMFMYLLSSLAMAHMEASLFLFVQDRFALTFLQASLGFAYVGVVIVFTQGFLIRKLMPLWGEKRLIFLGLTAAALGLFGIGNSHHIYVLAIAVTLLGLGTGLSTPALTGSMSLLAAVSEQGGTLGVSQSLAALGRILGPASGGFIYQHFHIAAPFVLGALMFLGALLIGLKIRRALPEHGRQANV